VPDLLKLQRPESKVMVKSTPLEELIKISDDVPQPFIAVVSAAAAASLADFSKKLQEIVTENTDVITRQSNEAKSLLAEMNLATLLDTSGSGLPDEVSSAVKQVTERGGHGSVVSLMEQVLAMSDENRRLMGRVLEQVDGEERHDADTRAHFPQIAERVSKSSRINSELRKHIANLSTKLTAATEADEIVKKKMRTHEVMFKMLSQGVAHVVEKCPAPGSSKSSTQATDVLMTVKVAKSKLDSVLSTREKLKEQLTVLSERQTPIAESTLAKSQPPYEEVVQQLLRANDKLVDEIRENVKAQEGHIAVILENAPKLRQGLDSAAKDREEFLKTVSIAANHYREVCDNLKEGLEWHSKFQDTLTAQLQRVTDFVASRMLEKQMVAESLSKEFAGMTVVDAVPVEPSAPDFR